LLKALAIILITGICALAPLTGAVAQEAAPSDAKTEALVDRLLDALNAKQGIEQNVQVMALAQIQAQPELAVFADVFKQFYRKYIGYDAIRDSLTEQYVDRFSQSELQELVEFYESDLGRKSTKFIPQIATHVLQEATLASQANAAELQSMVDAKTELLNMQ
jgi:hypothetical protein